VTERFPRPVKCLVLNVDIGSGHRMAAKALWSAIAEARPNSPCQIVESLDYLGPQVGKLAKDMYLGVLEQAPELWGAIYEGRGLTNLFRPIAELADEVRIGSMVPLVRQIDPDVVLAMHPIACGLAGALRRMEATDAPLVAVLTDFDAHPAWIARGIDLYLAPTDEVAAGLRAEGLPTGSAVTTGIPLRAPFRDIRSSSCPRSQLKLDDERFTVLLLGGGLGLGPIGETARMLISHGLPIQVVLIAGSNLELEGKARLWARESAVPFHVMGRVENIWDTMRAADVAIGKPGGLTCAELMAAGVPLVVLAPIPGQEQANSQMLVRRGAALEVDNPRGACEAVAELHGAPQRLASMRERALRIGRPDSAREAARHVLALVPEAARRPRASSDGADLDPLNQIGGVVASGIDALFRAADDAKPWDAVDDLFGMGRPRRRSRFSDEAARDPDVQAELDELEKKGRK